MRKRAVLLAFTCLLIGAPLRLVSGDYVEDLKAKVPYYQNSTTGRFAPMYEPLAQQMVQDYKLSSGVAIDVGSSCSPFAAHLAKKTQMTVYGLDIDSLAMRLLGILADEAGLTGRVIPVEGDATDMPFKDNFADFIFSRGCIPFVADQTQMLRECYRVLKPGGVAYIGHGGFGRLLDPKIRAELVGWRLGWGEDKQPKGWNGPKERMVDLAKEAGIKNRRLIKEPDVGWWLEIRK